MPTIRISLAVALGLVLMNCAAQTQAGGTPATGHADTHSTPTPVQETTQDQRQSPHGAKSAEHQHGDMRSSLRLDHGRPWATDAALVEGMDRIRAAVAMAAAPPALNPDSAAVLAQSVRSQVDFLIANCRLEPDADATLHVFIAQLLNAAAALQADPASPLGLPQMQQTLREYPRYFAHPGWQPGSVGKE